MGGERVYEKRNGTPALRSLVVMSGSTIISVRKLTMLSACITPLYSVPLNP